MKNGYTILSTLKNKYIRLRLAECILCGVAAGLTIYSALYIAHFDTGLRVSIAVAGGLIIAALRYFQLGLHRVSERAVAKFLDHHYPQLKASTDLLLVNDKSLAPLARLQQNQTLQALASVSGKIKFPHRIIAFSLITLAAISVVGYVQVNHLAFKPEQPGIETNRPANGEQVIAENLTAELKQAKVTVQPPAYTGIGWYSPDDLNLIVQENSRVSWTLVFSGPVTRVKLIASSRDSISLSKRSDREWTASTTLDRNGFYQLVWHNGSVQTSDYYKIEIIKDQPPVIKIPELSQFTKVDFDSRQVVDAQSSISDDYGLTDAYIIATVSKGSGESVKFREEKIPFAKPDNIHGRQIRVRQTLDLKKLGMEPGDELYFYVEAIDNKTPKPNRARTETYFITIPDTAQDVMAADGGLGVDLMPEYFRSQRQIIIDTEKLIREKKAITKKEFGSRSNELGYDQKVLRLRYGQFLGEEAESGVGQVEVPHEETEEHDENRKAADMVKEFGHQHDTENEHNLVEEKDPTKKDIDGSKKEDLLAGFTHEHDNAESATFFYQSLKMKLKAALAQMWDAELYLRLYEPEKSLPYQYTALKLLKEISNDSRIYVHRTGFEPPPIKEEKRLTADLNEVFTSTQRYEAVVQTYFPAIREALQVTENFLSRADKKLSQPEKNILRQSGAELAQAALENPALLQGLTALKTITSSGEPETEDVLVLRKTFWMALPKRPASAGKNSSALHELDNKLIQNLLREP